jgi:hypothetical protein
LLKAFPEPLLRAHDELPIFERIRDIGEYLNKTMPEALALKTPLTFKCLPDFKQRLMYEFAGDGSTAIEAAREKHSSRR